MVSGYVAQVTTTSRPDATPAEQSVQRPRLGLLRDAAGLAGSDNDAFAEVLAEVVEALEPLPYGVIGGVASAAYGRPRWTKDIDVFCRAEDAEAALERFAARSYRIERTNPMWIYKAFRDDVQIDVIFKVRSEVYLDEAMIERIRKLEVESVMVPVLAPEDIVVMKAMAVDEESPWHWYDALGILAAVDLDWEYLLLRARKSPNRVLSLLHYATSIDIPVSRRALRRLHSSVASSME
jgi:predicted nucleotidyltransferase